MNLYQRKKLQEAFDIYVREQDALLPDDETLSAVTLSPAFHAKMERLLTRRKRGFFVFFGTIGRRVASIAVALLLTATIATVSVEALREPVVRFFTRVYEKFTQIFVVDDVPTVSAALTFELRTPTYVPEGYTVEEEQALGMAYRVIYTNNDSQRITYIQQLKDAGSLTTDTEDVQYDVVKVNESDGIAYINKETTVVAFSDGEFVYRIVAPFSADEIIKIAESLQEK